MAARPGAQPPPCTIVVPVFNAFEATQRCLGALERHTPRDRRIALVDDASTDGRIAGLLRDFARLHGNAAVIVNPRNVGFAGSANRGLGGAVGDAVVLNSDTEVTAGWIEGLERCRASDRTIGIACPLSNNATLLTVEGVAELYRRADGSLDVDALGECVRRASRREYVGLPTAVGFCMLLTRELLDAVGAFDPAFGRGYGEENDLSMRALARGFRIACADDVYVHHAGAASFGAVAGLEAERAANEALLNRRWPGYAPGVAAWWRANPLRPSIERVNAGGERERLPGRPRVLLVMHRLEAEGGIEEHVRSLLEHLVDDAAFTVVAPMRPCGAWPDFLVERTRPHVRVARMTFELATPGLRVLGVPAEVADPHIEASFGHLLEGGFDVVHFHSLLGWNTLRLPRLAREFGARVVLTVHDKSWMCADFNMVAGTSAEPCGRVVARGSDPACPPCIASKASGPQGLLHSGVAAWLDRRHQAVLDAVAAADTLVCPSRFAAAFVAKAFGDATPMRVIGHGVGDWAPVEASRPGADLRVAHLGRFSTRKGAHLLMEAARRLEGRGIAFEAWGPVEPGLAGAAAQAGIRLHGPYANADLPRLLSGIDLVVVPTTLEETFCLVVTEAQQLGIPVAAGAIGAIPERVRDGESGFLFKAGDAAALAALLVRLRDDRTALAAVAGHLRAHRQKTHAEAAREYGALYRELAAKHRAPAGDPPDYLTRTR